MAYLYRTKSTRRKKKIACTNKRFVLKSRVELVDGGKITVRKNPGGGLRQGERERVFVLSNADSVHGPHFLRDFHSVKAHGDGSCPRKSCAHLCIRAVIRERRW